MGAMRSGTAFGAVVEGLLVAGLLIASVSPVLGVNVHTDAQVASQLHRIVGASVVDQDDLVGNTCWDIGDRLSQRTLGTVRGHGDHDFRHALPPRVKTAP